MLSSGEPASASPFAAGMMLQIWANPCLHIFNPLNCKMKFVLPLSHDLAVEKCTIASNNTTVLKGTG